LRIRCLFDTWIRADLEPWFFSLKVLRIEIWWIRN
jgi:hypothetical protein